MVPEITHCLGIAATGYAQAGASPLTGFKLDPTGLGGSVPLVLMGRRRGTPRGYIFCTCWWDCTIPHSPKGHDSSRMLLAANFSLLLPPNCFIPFQGGKGGLTSFMPVGPRLGLSRCSQAVRRDVYPASQTPKSPPRQEPHTHVPSRGEGRVALGTSHRQDMPMSH